MPQYEFGVHFGIFAIHKKSLNVFNLIIKFFVDTLIFTILS